MAGLMSDLPRKNGWTFAEHAGDRTPDRTQRLLNHAVWDQDRAQGVIRRFVVEHVGDQPLRVAALDESGQEKHGESTAGVKRQYMGLVATTSSGPRSLVPSPHPPTPANRVNTTRSKCGCRTTCAGAVPGGAIGGLVGLSAGVGVVLGKRVFS